MIRSARRSILKALALVAACSLSAGQRAEAQQSLELEFDQAWEIARHAASVGQYDLSRGLVEALLEADPDNVEALVLLALTTFQQGDFDASRRAAARAWRKSGTRQQRFDMARLAGRASLEGGRFLASQYWLRMAGSAAPSEEALEAARRDFRRVRELNPWKVNANLSFLPTNNVNNGSATDCNAIDGIFYLLNGEIVITCGRIAPSSQALPGIEATADLDFSYRLAEHPTRRSLIGGTVHLRRVLLNDDARTISPDSQNGDFGSTRLELWLAHDRILDWGAVGVKATAGQGWYAGEHVLNFGKLQAYATVPLSERNTLQLGAQTDQRLNVTNSFNDTTGRAITAALAHRFDTGARLEFAVQFSQTDSEAVNNRSSGRTAQVTWTPAEPIGPAHARLSLGVSQTDFPDFTAIFPVPGGRSDLTQFARLEMQFNDIDWWGFSPVVTLNGRWTDSNVSLYDSVQTGIGFSFRSTF